MVVLLSWGSRIEVFLRPVLRLGLSLVVLVHDIVKVSPLVLSRGLVLVIHGVVGHILASTRSSLRHGSGYQHGRVTMASALRLGSGGRYSSSASYPLGVIIQV